MAYGNAAEADQTLRSRLMEVRNFGNSGLKVSVLGYGAAAIGNNGVTEPEAQRMLNSVLDAGISLIDTARSYGLSEERIGRHLRHRRQEYVISTKVGYGIAGYEDWTGPCIAAGIDAALRRLQTDCIDMIHLHSCPLPTLQKEEILSALQAAIDAGKGRVAAYSGDNEELFWAVASDRFGGIQTSINLCDQHSIQTAQKAQKNGTGVLAKRPLANAPWRNAVATNGDDEAAATYRERWKAIGHNFAESDPPALFLRFAAYVPGVSSCIVGSSKLEHITQNVARIEQGPLPQDSIDAIRSAYNPSWRGRI